MPDEAWASMSHGGLVQRVSSQGSGNVTVPLVEALTGYFVALVSVPVYTVSTSVVDPTPGNSESVLQAPETNSVDFTEVVRFLAISRPPVVGYRPDEGLQSTGP